MLIPIIELWVPVPAPEHPPLKLDWGEAEYEVYLPDLVGQVIFLCGQKCKVVRTGDIVTVRAI